ncbi:hypothetical protein GGH12_002567 [Coemansia sp. RSA 1822]|nr:hypothetical protein LPJ76_000723 [Coemansia sp. RSA 638]KAJ2122871.1 hypothetical protein IW147_003037 [Coemansia sp. RSA 720]KAJ2545289.1 hypothetical protein GGF49_000523 [Coemansia sp. RSA 1853]KAJ2563484.1 hypothetical protein GGH12_002567 [Coemansia sp. RSA 1822]KAJ2666220.1 hypothetical protein IW148_001149 [Coemansia sp. RSA 1199]
MRFTLVTALLASLAVAMPVRRDLDGAKGAYGAIAGSADDAALVANTNTFFANLNGVASSDDINQSVKQVSDQISANHRDKVPTQLTAAWVSSVLNKYVA